VRELHSQVVRLSGLICALSQHLYELDGHRTCQSSKGLQLVRPSLTTDNKLHSTASRHLLHASRSDHFVSKDTKPGERREGGQVHVVTGPNDVPPHTRRGCFLTL
jgi:DNA mismatch repair ATPase MutS